MSAGSYETAQVLAFAWEQAGKPLLLEFMGNVKQSYQCILDSKILGAEYDCAAQILAFVQFQLELSV